MRDTYCSGCRTRSRRCLKSGSPATFPTGPHACSTPCAICTAAISTTPTSSTASARAGPQPSRSAPPSRSSSGARGSATPRPIRPHARRNRRCHPRRRMVQTQQRRVPAPQVAEHRACEPRPVWPFRLNCMCPCSNHFALMRPATSSTAASSSSSRPAAMPSTVRATGTLGTTPVPWCSLPSCLRTFMPVKPIE